MVVGSPGHLGGLRRQARTGTPMAHVPDCDFGQLYPAVGNRKLDWAFGSVASAGGMERAGRIRFIALATPGRDALHPAVPTTDGIASVRGLQAETESWGPIIAAARVRVD